jgi:hypothetical protein
MKIRTATSGIAIVQNSLADRDSDLAIANVMVSLIFPAAGDSRSMGIVSARQQTIVI